MDFYEQAGKMALGSRLRRLGERFTDEAANIYALYDVALEPIWFPVFYVLSQHEALSITEIAQITGQTHPWVSQVVKEMGRHELIVTRKSESDGRVNLVSLSEKGEQFLTRIEQQYLDVHQAVESLFAEMQHNLWHAIEEVEFLLDQKDFYTRVRETRKARERQNVEIIDYAPEFRDHFRQLNYEGIRDYFAVEEADRKALDNLEAKILDPGGYIFFARYEDAIVGTCALVKMNDETFELAKMAVTKQARGKGIGRLLGEVAIEKARALGATSVYLESNTRLEPAINLYYSLGFKKVVGPPSPYERCNIQMELRLDE